ncbi:hypothetical protein HPP92_022802 [Vanilla planifolia]|uniref:HECT-type E3 ubiquitin transferase n=1 Tax=Vanilla planifolia TaxID=51239 RepID=A0A835UDZ1_VANPL|nr:hypothetical protein HPP92_022802 [Vanilla planifolia]
MHWAFPSSDLHDPVTPGLLRFLFHSKRKLDEYLSPDLTVNTQFKIMRSAANTSIDGDSSLFSSSHSSSTSSTAISTSNSTLHFFVRTFCGTLVLHADPGETVATLITRISATIGVPLWDHRLIYRGRQLVVDHNLADYAIDRDATLQLVGRLRSTSFHAAWRVIGNMLSMVHCLLNEQPSSRGRGFSISSYVEEFLRKTPEAEPDIVGHLQAFILSGAHVALVKLYLSTSGRNRKRAFEAIRCFLNSPLLPKSSIPKSSWLLRLPILLEFCKLLIGTIGENDTLYIECRSSIGSLLASQDCRFLFDSNLRILMFEICPFVVELAEELIKGLSSQPMFVGSNVDDISKFLRAVRLLTQVGKSLEWINKFLVQKEDARMKPMSGSIILAVLHECKRSQLLAESFGYIDQVEAQALHGFLLIGFNNEVASGPGVLREWFCLLCQAIVNQENVLFLRCPNDQRRFFPNPESTNDPLNLKYFRFVGRVIALALRHGVQVGITFDHVFFLQLAGKSVTLEDIQDADPCLYMSCRKILEMDEETLDSDALGLTFVREIESLGTHRTVELCPGGMEIAVNSRNRKDYLFFRSLDLEGFNQMLGGSENAIDVIEWKAQTEYVGYSAKDPQIKWFWEILEKMNNEQKRVLLCFWTSLRYLPVNGFNGLMSKLFIFKSSASEDHLPTSQTCFYQLNLPQYSSESKMQDKILFIAQEHVSCSFGIC